MKPGFETEGLRNYKEGLANEKFDRLINCVINLNNVIATDESLGEGFCIGHSYFSEIKEVTDQKLSNIVEFELIPLLKEYWFDEPAKVRDWANSLRCNQVKGPLIQNIYYMLSYAFQVLNEQGYKDVATEQFENVAELCAVILGKGISLQLKRGLGKEYIEKTEPLSSIRGKIDISESIKTQTIKKAVDLFV